MKRALHSSAVKLIFILVANSLLIGCNDDPIQPEPIADFEVSSDTVIIGDPVIFTDLSTNNPTNWLWHFGDGNISTEQNPSHTYESLGLFSVFLKVSNEDGNNTAEKEDCVHVLEIMSTNPKASEFDLWVDENIMKVYDNPVYTGISIAFIDNDNVSKYHYGETKRNSNNIANDNTLYPISAITNTFTGISILRWLAQNDISLDSPIKSYLPDEVAPGLVYDNVDITFQHLLSHTSGLVTDVKPWDNCNSQADVDSLYIYNYLKNNNLIRKPGTLPLNGNPFYSNIGYGLLGLILERQNHNPLQEIYDDLIFNDIGMTSTTFSDIESYENIAFPYGGYGSGECEEIFDHSGAGQLAAIGINSNLSDMIKYVRFLLSYDTNTEIGKAITSSMEPQYQTQLDYHSGDIYICLPWYNKQTTSGDEIFFYGGWFSGFGTEFAINKTKDRAVIFSTNYWISESDYEFMMNLVNQYIDGTSTGGRKSSNSLKTRRIN